LSSQTVARRYASALADVITERREEALVSNELDGWAGMIGGHSNLLEAFNNPTVAYDQKRKVLSELISRTRVSETTANFLRVLLQNQRLAELPQINDKLAEILDERAGVVSAHVTSARPLSESVRNTLQQKVGELTGKRARLNFATDESLLGGVVTRIGSTIYDGSVKNELSRLRDELAG